MKCVISASRQTDIPAFYGGWLMNRVAEGFVGWQPAGGENPQLVSLQREDVQCLAFWSKNYRPFLLHARTLQQLGYPCYFNCTITGLPQEFEPSVVSPDYAVDTVRQLAELFSPEHLNWRYDPIVISHHTPPLYHVQRFTALAEALAGSVRRCTIRFPVRTKSNARNFYRFELLHGIRILDLSTVDQTYLVNQLAEIAGQYGITLHACCTDFLVGGPVRKGHCLDEEALAGIGGGDWQGVAGPWNSECGCVESVDIGRSNTCPHGCVYCFENTDKVKTVARYRMRDPASAFLGMPREEADRTVEEIRARETQMPR